MVSLADWTEVSNCFNSSSPVSHLTLPNSSSSETLKFHAQAWGRLCLCLRNLAVPYNYKQGTICNDNDNYVGEEWSVFEISFLSSENSGADLLRSKISMNTRMCVMRLRLCWFVCCRWSTETACAIANMRKSGRAQLISMRNFQPLPLLRQWEYGTAEWPQVARVQPDSGHHWREGSKPLMKGINYKK